MTLRVIKLGCAHSFIALMSISLSNKIISLFLVPTHNSTLTSCEEGERRHAAVRRGHPCAFTGSSKALWRAVPRGEVESRSACGLTPCPGTNWRWGRTTKPISVTFSRICKMRDFAQSLVTSGGFVQGTTSLYTEEMSSTASPTMPSSQLTSDQLTVVAASCKYNI